MVLFARKADGGRGYPQDRSQLAHWFGPNQLEELLPGIRAVGFQFEVLVVVGSAVDAATMQT